MNVLDGPALNIRTVGLTTTTPVVNITTLINVGGFIMRYTITLMRREDVDFCDGTDERVYGCSYSGSYTLSEVMEHIKKWRGKEYPEFIIEIA